MPCGSTRCGLLAWKPVQPGEIFCDGAGRVLRAVDSAGIEAWSLRWQGDALVDARLRLPGGDVIGLRPAAGEHPLIGACDAIVRGDGTIVAHVASVQWSRPTCIPAVDVPGALPPGAGTAILDLVATLAQHGGAVALRYRGPYPTSGLFATLLHSFRVEGDRELADARFVAAVAEVGFGTDIHTPDVDFEPDPHRWSWPAPRLCVEHRRGVARVWVDGRAYAPDGRHHRLVREGERWCAQLVLAGAVWCEVAAVDLHGAPQSTIAAPTPVDPALVGVALPAAMLDVLATIVADGAAPALRDGIGRAIGRGITLGDTGMQAAREQAGAIVVHGGLVERALGLGGAESLVAIAQAVGPVAVHLAVAELAARLGALTR